MADGLVPHLTDPDVIHGMDEDDPLEMSVSTAMDDVLDFGPWVNQVRQTLELSTLSKLFWFTQRSLFLDTNYGCSTTILRGCNPAFQTTGVSCLPWF